MSSVSIITGSATGIGAACALGLATRGWRCVINYSRSETEARETAAACERAGGEPLLVRADVADDSDCRRLADTALEKWGRIDALINNAATTKSVFNHADLAALDAGDFHRIYSVNVIGAFQMIRAVEPAMRGQGRGSVVNVSSRAGLDGVGSSVAYAASKGALNTMTMSLARALGPEIRVNAVCPGFVETRWLQHALGERYEAARERYANNSALHRTSTPEDIADVIVWLVEAASQVTGQLIRVDGGNWLGAPHRRPAPRRT